ncbi:MAG: hypothetical protein ACRDTE_13560 [Pseudonocardiaceae bacterium]
MVLRPGAELTLAELAVAYEQQGVAAFKVPERLEILPALPLTNVGKIDKKALRARFAGH